MASNSTSVPEPAMQTSQTKIEESITETNAGEPISRTQRFTTEKRELTEVEKGKLKKDTKKIPEFWKNKYIKESQKHWDLFYKRNQVNFYKDRHWTTREFPELSPLEAENQTSDDKKKTMFEVGCGVGNTFFPLLKKDSSLFVHCCDLSARAIDFIKKNDEYSESRVNAFVADITDFILTDKIPPESVDIATMIFVLSALHPDKMKQAIRNVKSVLKPGGIVLFRDYGINDHAMLRFKPGHKIMENLYVRQDSTLAYYFDIVWLKELFEEEGFSVESNEYLLTETINRKEEKRVDRVFVQSRFIKK